MTTATQQQTTKKTGPVPVRLPRLYQVTAYAVLATLGMMWFGGICTTVIAIRWAQSYSEAIKARDARQRD